MFCHVGQPRVVQSGTNILLKRRQIGDIIRVPRDCCKQSSSYHCPIAKRIGEEEMFQPQIRPLTRLLPAIALLVVGVALVLLLFR